ncbi:hypothetical protein SAMN05216559_0445 [Halomicrobium zhouii]|uniref:Uncharacterized protein n=1 Tax=Halomicrobium zhouii TaxID=767519 RepID=A0A1I6KA54_9EURY|nr:hypothetical protein [Halomicrobium zhouii]SFR88101.1 hypothetical protein SAMN05216559_0445 [Halomicrobium zhouii]
MTGSASGIGNASAGRITGGAAAMAGLSAFVLTGVDTLATLVGVASVLLLLTALGRSSRVLATLAGVGLFGELVLAAASGAPAGPLLAAAVGIILSWTFAHAAIDLAESVGTAPSRDLELAHLAGTTAVVAGPAVALYLVYSVEWGSVPPLALALILFGAVSLTAALRR